MAISAPSQCAKMAIFYDDYLSFLGRPALSGSRLPISVFKLATSVLLSSSTPIRKSWLFFTSIPAARHIFLAWLNNAYSDSGMVKLSRTSLAFFAFSLTSAATAGDADVDRALPLPFVAGLLIALAVTAGLLATVAAVMTFDTAFTGALDTVFFTTALAAAVAIFFAGTTDALTGAGVGAFFVGAVAMTNSSGKKQLN